MRGPKVVIISEVSLDQRIRGVGSLSTDTCELGVFALSMLSQTLIEEHLCFTFQCKLLCCFKVPL